MESQNLIGKKIGDKIYDLCTLQEENLEHAPDGEPIYYDDSESALEILRHSCAHLMAQAIKELYADAQFFVGPVVDEGFYYDFKTEKKIGEDDLPLIESKMKEIAKRAYPITKYTTTRKDAQQRFANDELKLAVMDRIQGDRFSFYTQGDFEDLCRGPHLPNTKFLQHFKLTKLSGAYLGGDESAQMLHRIYGIAFSSKEALKDYLFQIEEAKKRDHRKLALSMGLFSFDDEIGAGLPIWLPKGARLRRNIESLLTQALIARDYEPVRGPEILKSEVWKKSGHYDNYKENMYFTSIDEVEYGIKPMNCVGHIKVYQSSPRSYRDLPLRFYEYGVVHRHEKSGVLHGLLRVREFTQDDAHIFCTSSQIESEVAYILDFTKSILEVFGFSYEMELSTRPKKSIGDDAVWESATQALKKALDDNKIAYKIDEGGGAFYGPKIDIKITDALKRKWQCGTIQIDMNLPSRFGLSYTDEDNLPKTPIMIHRAILGSFERFIAILIEHYAGEFPLFIAPTQVCLIPITQAHTTYALALRQRIVRNSSAYVEVFDKNETLAKRIRTAEKQHIPLIVVIGDKEIEDKILSVRDRSTREQYSLSEEEFIQMLQTKLSEVRF